MTRLSCPDCGRTYSPGPEEPWRCACGHALDFDSTPDVDADARPSPADLDRDRGVWAFDAFLPVERRASLGEGWTPLVDADDWDVTAKLEYALPSGSFKDRGAAVTLSRAATLGVDRVIEDSSGNAGLATAQYAARAGIPARIYVPDSTPAGKREAIERTGASVVAVPGERAAATRAAVDAVDAGDGWYASHAWNPAFYAGAATFALELAAQRAWSVPDAVVTPIGHGTLFLGAYRGFRALRAADWIDDVPRMLGVQAAGRAPVVAALHGESAAAGANSVAAGVQIREPARLDQVLDAVDATDGDAVAVDADATESSLSALHRAGFLAAPTSAVAVAGLSGLRERGALDPGDDVVVALTGTARTRP